MKKIAVLPVRSSSKRIPRKNFQEFCGIPLYSVVLAELVSSECFDCVVFAFDKNETLPDGLNTDNRVVLYKRAEENSQDGSSSEDLMREINEYLRLDPQDFIFLFQATNPFLRREYVQAATEESSLENADSIISFVETKRFSISEITAPEFVRQRTQVRDTSELETGLLWGTRSSVLRRKNSRIGDQPHFVKIASNDDFDIDTLEDLDFIWPKLENYIENNSAIHAKLFDWFPLEMKLLLRQSETKRAMRDTFQRSTIKNIKVVAEQIKGSLKAGGKVVLFGNGGSAADSQHIAAEFISKLKTDRNSLAAIALTTDTSAITAIGNDYGFEHVFERQVASLVKPEDVVIGITTSGQSNNVLRGLTTANKMGAFTVMLTGKGAKEHHDCQVILRSSSLETAAIQEIHIQMGHMICALSEEEYV